MNDITRILLMIIFSICIGFMIGFPIGSQYGEGASITDLEYAEACMDGCSNMEKTMFGGLDFENETKRLQRTICSDSCFEKFINR